MSSDRPALDPIVRVVSLVPSATETLLALGADVVACTRFCEQPHVRHVGGTKNPDIDAIVVLDPDLVVVDEEENRRADAEGLSAAGLRLHVTSVRDVAGALDVVAALASVTAGHVPAGWAPEPDHVAVAREPAALPVVRRAFVPIWRRPWMSINADTYGASVLAAAGVELVTASATERYPTVELADITASAPDLVLVPSEPYTYTAAHLAELRQVFPAADVRRIDGQDLFWWGIRTPGALARIADAVRPTRTTR